ncbi:MAG: ATP-binding protein, partial [Candidatus Acidiferrales bacterium]
TIGEEAAVSALKDGAQDYVMKSNLQRLVPCVQRELRDRQERRERKGLERQVQTLQKFEAIGRLAGGIAHDFNNVIGAILGWAELCYQEAVPGTSLQDRLKKIMNQAERAGALTSQLLAFARCQVLQPKRTDLNALVAQGTTLLRRVIGEHIEINMVPCPDLHTTLVDPVQIDQVIMNLCINARDAMPKGGRLTLETKNVEVSEDFCRRVPYANPGSYVTLAVSDTGTGIAPEVMEQIFEPFFTTKELGKGTGLGLATVYGIVKQHGGFITVDSEVGMGTVFLVYLAAGSGAAEPRSSEPEEKPPMGRELILLAEDHEGLRQSAQEMLATLGYTVVLASNGLEAVERFKKSVHRIEAVVLDVVMPNFSGVEAYTQMAAIRPDLPVVFTTGYASETASLTALVEHGAQLLQKPFAQRGIGQAIRAVLDGKPARK